MKVYTLSTPEQLKAAAEIAKWQNDRLKMQAVATVWSSSIRQNPEANIPFRVTIELGRSAIVFKESDKEKTPLGNLYVVGARQFVADEGLVERK